MSSAPRLGKYFFIRAKDNPALVLEIEDGLDQPHANVLLGEVSGNAQRAHQFWFIDSVTVTIRSKLNQFCLDANSMYHFLNFFKLL